MVFCCFSTDYLLPTTYSFESVVANNFHFSPPFFHFSIPHFSSSIMLTTLKTRLKRASRQLPLLASALLLAPTAWAQITIPTGNPTGTTNRKPLGTYFGFERSAAIYTAADISGSGSITSVGFYLESIAAPIAAVPTRIFLKTTTNTSFAAGTTVAAEQTGATLVYNATIPVSSFTAGTWVTVALTAPFTVTATDNLEIIVETNGGGTGTEGSAAKVFRFTSAGTNRFQSWQADNAAPTAAGTLATARPNVQLTGLTPVACVAPSSLTVTNTGTAGTTANVTFTAGNGNTGYTLTYTPTGGTPVTQTVTASPVALTGLTPSTTYAVSLVGNCAGGATSATATTTFTTSAPSLVNDNPAGAVTLTVGTTCTPVNGTNVGATTTTAAGYVNPSLTAGCGIAGSPKDVWYKFTTAATGTGSTSATITVTGSAAGYLRGFSSAAGATGPFTEIGCAAGTTNNTVSAPLSLSSLMPSTTYYVFVSGYGSLDTQGAFTICATASAAAVCNAPTAVTVTNATGTSLQVNFTPGTNNTSYTVSYTTGGAATTVNATASPVTLTGLMAGTTYTITVQALCSAGGTAAPVVIAGTTTGTPPAPSYVGLPYTEGFEANWVNARSIRDVPTNSWRNTPATGDNSWRREDDGFASANWRFVGNEMPTTAFPIPPYVIRFSTGAHSARFHSFGANVGLQGRFDLYVNMSGPVSKALSFDYINPTGTDKLEVFVSTDGGTTFAATPILTATTNAAFTAKTVSIASTSATTVVRFLATSDFGDNDIGIDNVQLRVVSATTNPALAAAVALYPNPASRAFTLSVPAGSLRTASATLTNALGQVVQTRALSATGTTVFDVSGLAAGMYSLTLKSGNDLVVKRVVVE